MNFKNEKDLRTIRTGAVLDVPDLSQVDILNDGIKHTVNRSIIILWYIKKLFILFYLTSISYYLRHLIFIPPYIRMLC